jgi:transposase InsO family protein
MDDGSRMSCEVHVRFCEGPKVQSLRPTHPYIAIAVGFVYVAVILDARSRRVVGYAISRSIDARLTIAALRSAIERRKPPPGCMHHSDSQRVNASFRAA